MDILHLLFVGVVIAGGVALWRILRALPSEPWSELDYRRMVQPPAKEADETPTHPA